MNNDLKNNITEKSESISKQFAKLNQDEMPIKTYYEKVRKLSSLLGLPDDEIKERFLVGLTSENRLAVCRIGIKEPLDLLVNILAQIEKNQTRNEDNITKDPELVKRIIGGLNQEGMSTYTYYGIIKKCCRLLKFSDNDTKMIFLRGLTPNNWKEAIVIGLNTPLNKIVEKLKKIEDWE